MKSNNRRITVVFVIDFLITREGVTGGTERQLVETLNRLDKKRFRPILICLQDLHPTKLWDKINTEKYFLHVYSMKTFDTLSKLFRFARFLRRNSTDIVQTFFYDATIFGTIAAKIAGVPKIISCKRDLGFWYDHKLLFALKYVGKLVDYYIVNCAAIKKVIVELEKAQPDKIRIMPNGIDLDKAATRSAAHQRGDHLETISNHFTVGIVANFNREVKRVDLFIRAAREVLNVHPEILFCIIGGGKLEPELRKLALHLGIQNSILFVGKVANPNIFLEKMNIGINCSDSEGLSNVILEYFAHKLPVIATNVGGNAELISEDINGCLVPGNNYQALAQKIIYLHEHEEIAKKMGEMGYKMVKKKYSWDNSISVLEEFYGQITER